MEIGILGAGNVGRALGLRWAALGHAIRFGVRAPGDDRHTTLARRNVTVGTLEDAARGARVVVLATPHPETPSILAAARIAPGTIVIDATNPLKPDLSGLALDGEPSAGERVQRLLPHTRVVKAFNTIGFNVMEDPGFGDRRAVMYLAGDDAEAKACVLELAEELGFEALDLGDLAQSRLLEPLAMVWIRSAYALGLGREIAFGLLRR